MPKVGGREIPESKVAARVAFWVAAVGGAGLDLVSKSLIFRFCTERAVLIPSFLAISCVKNYGGVWGLGRGRSILFLAVTLAALVAILFFRRRYYPESTIVELAFGLVVAGAVGNACDRLVTFPNSFVRDFIDVQLHLPRLDHWPTFNLADAFICIGVALLLLHSFIVGDAGEKEQEAPAK